jgi:hypothetical protein
VKIWVTADGQLTRLPVTSADVDDQVIFTVVSVSMALALAAGFAAGVIRLLRNCRRMTGWQRAWDMVGPTWSRHA